MVPSSLFFFFLNNPATTETYPLPRPAALPIWAGGGTSVTSSRSRPPVARITQARIGGLGQERRGHHQLGAGRRERHGRARADRHHVDAVEALPHGHDQSQ